eukprot:SAG11_NODE_23258_length_392_cov_0.638225_1_plen_130_part_11
MEEPKLRDTPVRCAGSAFVAFKTPSTCRKFQKDVNAGVEGARGWRAEPAPRPNEIYWENFGLGTPQKMLNHAKSYTYTLGVFLLFVIISLCCVWCVGYLYMDVIYQVKPIDKVQEILYPMQEAVSPFIWY